MLAIRLEGKFEDKGSLFFTYGSEETVSTPLHFVAGQDYDIEIVYRTHDRQLQPELETQLDPMEDKFQGVRFGYEEDDLSDLPTEAATRPLLSSGGTRSGRRRDRTYPSLSCPVIRCA